MSLIRLNLTQPEKRASPKPAMNSPADWQWFGGGHGSDAGEVVSEATALSISTV
jgi:hypothetical protein